MITVITSVTGGKDNLIHNQVKGNAKFLAFTDFDFESDVWERRKAYDRLTSPRRNSRVPKILAHQYADTRYSIWLDGNLKLLVSPEDLIEKYLKNHDIAAFKHPARDCLYDEAQTCIDMKIDDEATIREQVKKYEAEGFGRNRGLTENAVLIRRHTAKVEQFNNYWWSEYARHSVRDQLSMFYALDKAGLEINQIPDQYEIIGNRVLRGGMVEYVNHLTDRKE